MGPKSAQAIQGIIERAGQLSGSGIFSTIMGTVMLLVGALGVFARIKAALNTAWDITHSPYKGMWGFVRGRLLSFAMVMCVAFLLLVTLVVGAMPALLGKWMGDVSLPAFLLTIVNTVVLVAIITVQFAAMYKFLPDV